MLCHGNAGKMPSSTAVRGEALPVVTYKVQFTREESLARSLCRPPQETSYSTQSSGHPKKGPITFGRSQTSSAESALGRLGVGPRTDSPLYALVVQARTSLHTNNTSGYHADNWYSICTHYA
jgi:hypothetical protein